MASLGATLFDRMRSVISRFSAISSLSSTSAQAQYDSSGKGGLTSSKKLRGQSARPEQSRKTTMRPWWEPSNSRSAVRHQEHQVCDLSGFVSGNFAALCELLQRQLVANKRCKGDSSSVPCVGARCTPCGGLVGLMTTVSPDGCCRHHSRPQIIQTTIESVCLNQYLYEYTCHEITLSFLL